MLAIAVAAIFASPVVSVAYQLCNAAQSPFTGQTVNVTLVRGPTAAFISGGNTVGISVTGTITIDDGCTVISN